jgi:tetratricopeptide (TPR) repeat protein
MAEAVDVMVAGINAYVLVQNWSAAAVGACNLSELSLTLGDVSSAVRQGEQSVELADLSGDAFERLSDRTTLADALHASGEMGPALAAFREAETMQQEREPEYPLLYSLPGYLYCDLLLDEMEAGMKGEGGKMKEEGQDSDGSSLLSRLREVRNRAEEMLREHPSLSLLSIALHHLALGRTYLAEAAFRKSEISNPTSEMEAAEHHLNESVSLLRQAGDQDMLSRGLLQRAALWRVRFEISKAERDLAEAESIAERGSMRIWQIEASLERCRLALALASVTSVSPGSNQSRPDGATNEAQRTQSDWIEQARQKLDEARELIRQTEKPYEPHVPDWPDWQPPEYIGVFQKGDIVGYHCRNTEIERLQQAINPMS